MLRTIDGTGKCVGATRVWVHRVHDLSDPLVDTSADAVFHFARHRFDADSPTEEDSFVVRRRFDEACAEDSKEEEEDPDVEDDEDEDDSFDVRPRRSLLERFCCSKGDAPSAPSLSARRRSTRQATLRRVLSWSRRPPIIYVSIILTLILSVVVTWRLYRNGLIPDWIYDEVDE